jgi:hypothetical protein
MREKLVALYPLVNVLTLTGFLAAVLLFLGLNPLWTATISLWFCFVGVLTVYWMGKKPLKLLGLDRFVRTLLFLTGFLALLSAVSLVM